MPFDRYIVVHMRGSRGGGNKGLQTTLPAVAKHSIDKDIQGLKYIFIWIFLNCDMYNKTSQGQCIRPNFVCLI